jgi:hypothetical protein
VSGFFAGCPGFSIPDFLRLKYYRLLIYQLAHWRIRDTFGYDFLNDQAQIRTTAGIIPSVCGRWSLSG